MYGSNISELARNYSPVPNWDPIDRDQITGLVPEDGYFEGTLQHYAILLTEDTIQFIYSQFNRFRITPFPSQELMSWCWQFVIYYIDVWDPYCLYDGILDVILTTDPYYYQFSVQYRDGSWHEASPEAIEHFTTWNGYPKTWDMYMNNPGLIKGYFHDAWEFLLDEYIPNTDSFKKLESSYGHTLALDLIQLSVWSIFGWLTSPISSAHSWRATYLPIFDICYQWGECVASGGYDFWAPGEFIKLNRPAKTCVLCGIQEYCVELVDDIYRNGAAFVCERCSHGDTIQGKACGRRDCGNTSCSNHPGARINNQARANRNFGELRQIEGMAMPMRALPGHITTNNVLINHYATSIADIVGRELHRMIGPK